MSREQILEVLGDTLTILANTPAYALGDTHLRLSLVTQAVRQQVEADRERERKAA